jgi:hypothetical protein
MYADDTTLLISDKSLNNLFRVANSELTAITNWFHDNKLCINFTKTNYMVFTNSVVNNLSLNLNNINIESKPFVKFLGIILDNKLNWKDHINCLILKLSHDVAMLKVASHCLPKSCLLTLYFSFFHSHMSYAINFWSNAGTTFCEPIRSLQIKESTIFDKQYYIITAYITQYT